MHASNEAIFCLKTLKFELNLSLKSLKTSLRLCLFSAGHHNLWSDVLEVVWVDRHLELLLFLLFCHRRIFCRVLQQVNLAPLSVLRYWLGTRL